MAALEQALLELDGTLPAWMTKGPPLPTALHVQVQQPTPQPSASPPSNPLLASIAYLFVAFAHGTDGVITTEEMRALADRLRRWDAQVGLDGIGHVLREAVQAYRTTASQPAWLEHHRTTLAQ